MHKIVGVLVMEHIAVGLVESHQVLGALNIFPEKPQLLDPLQSMPAERIVDCIRQQIEKVADGEKIAAIGIGFPGIIRSGVVEDSPNFQQAKGFAFQAALSSALSGKLAGTQRRNLGRRALRRHPRHQGNFLRLRRPRPSGRNPRAPLHAHAVHGS